MPNSLTNSLLLGAVVVMAGCGKSIEIGDLALCADEVSALSNERDVFWVSETPAITEVRKAYLWGKGIGCFRGRVRVVGAISAFGKFGTMRRYEKQIQVDSIRVLQVFP
jgi:hypothetical protein